MAILRCENLTKIYGEGENLVKALDGVSLSIEKGEFVSVTGPSGSGKSTLLHILGGVDKATSGKVIINDTDISALDEDKLAVFRRRQIGIVYQSTISCLCLILMKILHFRIFSTEDLLIWRDLIKL